MTIPATSPLRPRNSTAALGAHIVLPEHGHFDEARQAWNLAVDQRPAAVALPETAADVIASVQLARDFGLRIAPQSTGHNAGPLGDLSDTLLLRTSRLRGVTIDPRARIARVEGGAIWSDVAAAAGDNGLAALAGSSPDVGVAGYTLGGGLSWLSRRHGLAANNVHAIELVTADGRLVRADHDNETELFWALRGGGGSFGIVTALELRLLPIIDVYAGLLWFPIDRGSEVMHAWRELTAGDLPDELTTVGRFLRPPAIPEVPEAIRGRAFAVVEVFHLGDPAEADELLAPLRALGPVNDTVASVPAPALGHLHMDPEHPVPGFGDGATLAELPPRAIDALVQVAGAQADFPLLSVEVRHLEGEVARRSPQAGALDAIDAKYVMYAVGMVPVPELHAQVAAQVEAVKHALEPWVAGHQYLNFAETSQAVTSFWRPETYDRLRRVKALVDPDDVIRSNRPIPPAA